MTQTYYRLSLRIDGNKAFVIIPQVRKQMEPYKSNGTITHEITGIETTAMVNNVGLIPGAIVKTIGGNIEIITINIYT